MIHSLTTVSVCIYRNRIPLTFNFLIIPAIQNQTQKLGQTKQLLEERKMVRANELKGGEGSIRVGTTGKVSALMMQELDLVTSSSKACSTSSKRRIQMAPVSISCGASTRRLQQKKASSSNSSRNVGGSTSSSQQRTPGSIQRKKQNTVQTSQNIPMLGSENISVSNTPNRVEQRKKRLQIVEIVDVSCGRPDGARSKPISSQLKRLSFSKLSD